MCIGLCSKRKDGWIDGRRNERRRQQTLSIWCVCVLFKTLLMLEAEGMRWMRAYVCIEEEAMLGYNQGQKKTLRRVSQKVAVEGCC